MRFLGGPGHFPWGAARPVSRRQMREASALIRIDLGMRVGGFLNAVLLFEIRMEMRPGRLASQWGSSIHRSTPADEPWAAPYPPRNPPNTQ